MMPLFYCYYLNSDIGKNIQARWLRSDYTHLFIFIMPSSLKPKATENAIPNVIVGKKKTLCAYLSLDLKN